MNANPTHRIELRAEPLYALVALRVMMALLAAFLLWPIETLSELAQRPHWRRVS